MQLMQRFGSEYSEEYIDRCFKMIKAHPGSCDNIWLATPYGFPPLEKHRAYAEELKKTAKRFRDAGISVSLQLSNSIGHGEYMSSCDCTGLVYENAPTEYMVGTDGTVAHYCFCPMGKHFRAYLLEEIAIYAELHPDCLWVDDDFRAANHNPVKYGCFCDDCIARFNRKHKTAYTRDELVNEVLHGALSVRDAFLSDLRDGFSDLMMQIGKTLHAISPETRLGMQYGHHGAYPGHGSAFILDAMRASTGHAPLTRPGGGAYDDTNPTNFLSKGWALSAQNAMLPDYVTVRCPEIENLPFVAYGKTPAGTAFETAFYFASGNTDMSYSMFMHLREPDSFYEKTLSLFAGNRPYWDRLSEVNLHTAPDGLHVVVAEQAWKKKIGPGEGFAKLSEEPYYGAYALQYDAVPLTLEASGNGVSLLHPEAAALLEDDEIDALLAKNVITDGESLEILAARGYDLGVKARKFDEKTTLKLSETLTDHPINPVGFRDWESSYFTPGKPDSYALFTDRTDAEVIGFYYTTVPVPPLCPDGAYPFGISSLVIPTGKGGKWVILGYAPWKAVISREKRDQLLNAADYIGASLAARLLSDEKAFLHPRINTAGQTEAVSLTNVTVGESGTMELFIRNPASKDFTLMTQGKTVMHLPYTETADGCIVKVPSLAGWSVGTVFTE